MLTGEEDPDLKGVFTTAEKFDPAVNFNFDSLILPNTNMHGDLKQLIPKATKFELLYRFTRDGNVNKFHEKCDGAGPTLVIVKSENDRILGGYTDIPWASQGGDQKGNGNTFVYSVRENGSIKKLKISQGFTESYHAKDYLQFGNEVIEIGTSNQCQTKFLKNDGVMFDPKIDINCYFTGKRKFAVTEIEVFKCIE